MSEFPHVAPPADGLHLAMAAARNRRLRTAGTSSGVLASALVVLALLAGTSGRQSLVQQPTPEVPAVAPVDEVPTPRATAPGPDPTRPPSGARVLAAPAAGGSTAAHRTRPAEPGTEPAASSALPSTGPMSSYAVSPNFFDGCPVDKSKARQPVVCPNAAVIRWDDQAGVHHTDLQGTVCSFDARDTELTFATTREMDFTVRDTAGREVWRWSVGHPEVAHPHVLRLATGDCWQWAVSWGAVDQAGNAVPAGDYTVVAESTAAELGAGNSAETTYNVS